MDIKNFIISKKYFIFDLDGTIVDLEELNYTSFRDTVSHFLNVTLTYDEYLKYFAGSGSKAGFERYFSERSLSESVDLNQKYYREIKREALHNRFDEVVKVKDGVIEFLKALKKSKRKIALGTSNTKEFAILILKNSSLYEYFDAIVTQEDVENTKPHPEIFLKALELIGGSVDSACVFEDSPTGINCAKNANIDCIVVYTKGRNEVSLGGDNVYIESFKECF